MKKNIRVPVSFSQGPDGQMPMVYPVAISLVCHLVFLLVFVITPGLRSEKPMASSVINVSMVSMKKEAAATTKTPAAKKKSPTVMKPDTAKKPVIRQPEKKAVKKTTPKAAKPPPKPKTSLKKKTFKATQVVKAAIEQLETKATSPEPKPDAVEEPLQSALERLRKEVGETEATQRTTAATSTPAAAGKSGGKSGPINEDGKKRAELIDLYRLEIAFQIQKNWAFNQQLAGGDQSLQAAIVFKVMSDGEIRDVFFTDRSGNTYLDESAYKAIVKSNPVDAHPNGLVQPYVVMAIRFTPQGIR